MSTDRTTTLVNRIIKRYGAVIDLRANPEVIVDILRHFADDVPDGGTPCGGVPNPPPPPSPSRVGDWVTNEELMKEVLKLARAVSAIRRSLAATTPTATKARGRE